MPDFEQHRFRLTLDLFEQYFLRAHVRNVSRPRAAGKSGVWSVANGGDRME
jgi:hypothetical protein